MKLNKTLTFISIGLISVLAIGCMDTPETGKQSDKNNLLLLALLSRNPSNSEARKYCANAVVRMNQCIGSGSGFNPAVMCSDTNLQAAGSYTDTSVTPNATITYTAVDVYQRLISCVDTQVAATNCNFTQNKVASPPQAKAADRKSTRLNSSHGGISRMPSSA